MKRLVFQSLACACFLCAAACIAQGEGEEALRLVVDLKDGSRIIGTTDLKALPLVSANYGKVEIILKAVESIVFQDDKGMVQVKLQNEDRLTGVIGLSAFKLEVLFGKVSIPIVHVIAVYVQSATGAGASKIPALPGTSPSVRAKEAMTRNEQTAIATLRSIAAAQQTFQTKRYVDKDNDGHGEYGFLQEISGVAVRRCLPPDFGFDAVVVKPGLGEILPQALGTVDADGRATRSGYMFHMFLPSDTHAGTDAIPETRIMPPAAIANANAQETRWCCYAWPVKWGETGKRAFVINQQGQVYETDCSILEYSGGTAAPVANAAFIVGVRNIDGALAARAAAIDGNVWVPSGG